MLKDYSEALYENDYDSLSKLLEPKFSKRLGSTLEDLHLNLLPDNNLKLNIEFHKKGLDETEFFLYNIENYMLVGANIDRTKNKLKHKYAVTED